MGMTLVEKVISQHCGKRAVGPGDTVLAEADRIFCYGSALETLCGVPEGEMPLYPGRVVVAFDQWAGESSVGERHRIAPAVRRLVRSWKIDNFYDLGRGGIPAVGFADSGLARPGDFLAGADRQTLMFGALGAVPLLLGVGEIRRCLFEGEVEIVVPATVRIDLEGDLQRWVGGHDIGSYIADTVDLSAVRHKALEIGGSVVAALDHHDRFSLAAALDVLKPAMVVIEGDEKTRVYVRSRCDKGFPLLTSDRDASFDDRMTIDCGRLRPQIVLDALSRPGAAENGEGERRTISVDEARGRPVDHVIIGASSHGRIEDIRVVAGFLRDYLVDPAVTLTVVPGSQQVLLHAMDEGLTQIIIRAGGHVAVPSSRYNRVAHRGAIAEGGHLLSAAFCPAMDLKELARGAGSVSFCSPAMATAASIIGAIQTPLDLARNVNRMATGMTR